MKLLKFLLVLVPFSIVAAVAGFYGYIAFSVEPLLFSREQLIALGLLVAIGVTFLILFMPFSYILDEKPFRKMQWNRFLLFSIMLGAIGFLLVDIEPQSSPYSITDLQTQNPDTGSAAFLSRSLFKGQVERPVWVEEFKEKPQLLRDVTNYEEQIRKSWRQIRTQRVVLEQLAALESFPQPGVEYIQGGELPDFMWLRDIASIYQGYTLLSSRQGDLETALNELNIIQQVARKGFEGSPLFISKMMWSDILNMNLSTAYQLVEEYGLTGTDLERVAALFPPLSAQEMSTHNPWLGEYLAVKHQAAKGAPLMEGLVPEPSFIPAEWNVVETIYPYLYEGLYYLTFRKNMTDKLVDDTYVPLIKETEKKPVVSADTWEEINALSRKPTVRNLSGWYLFRSQGSVELGDMVVQVKVRSDLLALFLDGKQGRQRVIPDYFSGEENKMKILNENLVSAGGDTVFDTDDDIRLNLLY
ncbi:hypothetical protein [Desulfopila sp. IMCC35008]|uniref:hypothetical protein n=1 Tax=Desulfopila sp. IMCC35008 TaxID=2653858 RepID=UPI0013D6B8C8|nr:hypothetical protein [Desulfopila sp. IMCC35008]